MDSGIYPADKGVGNYDCEPYGHLSTTALILLSPDALYPTP